MYIFQGVVTWLALSPIVGVVVEQEVSMGGIHLQEQKTGRTQIQVSELKRQWKISTFHVLCCCCEWNLLSFTECPLK